MNTYLAIITTALVATQIVRVIQNQVSLRKQNKLFEQNCNHLKNAYPTEQDFETQREAYRLIVDHFRYEDAIYGVDTPYHSLSLEEKNDS